MKMLSKGNDGRNRGEIIYIDDLVPKDHLHFTTLSNNFCHRFTEETVERVFNWILSEINKAGYLSPEAVFIDGTHTLYISSRLDSQSRLGQA